MAGIISPPFYLLNFLSKSLSHIHDRFATDFVGFRFGGMGEGSLLTDNYRKLLMEMAQSIVCLVDKEKICRASLDSSNS